jgi:hypothetical protein
MNFFKLYIIFCFITYPISLTFLVLSKLEKNYSNELLISGVVLIILDSVGITLYCCKKEKMIDQK